MRKIAKHPFRTAKTKLNKKYIVTIKRKNGFLCMPIPKEIIKVFGIEVGDAAVFEIINNKSFSVRFVKKDMYSLVERF